MNTRIIKLASALLAGCVLGAGVYLGAHIDDINRSWAVYKQSNDLNAAMREFRESGNKPRKLLKVLDPLACDLNQTSCTMSDGKTIIEISPQPVVVLGEAQIFIKNPLLKNPSLKAVGLNMYMGLFVDEFEQVDGGWSADVVFSACTEEIMRYRLELLDNGISTGAWIDLDIRR